MKKEINCTWTMSGTYHLDEKSVCAARKKALGNLPLPEDRDYLNDSLMVGDLTECMVANGWDESEVEELSLLTPEALIRTLDERYRMGLEVIPGTPHTTTRLKAFLLDYYGVEYTDPKDVEAPAEKDIPSAKKCFIVVYSNSDGTDAYAFESEEGARKSIAEDVETTMQELLQQGWRPKVLTDACGNSEIYVPDTNISYEWDLVTSTIRA